MARKRYTVEFRFSPDSMTWLVRHAGKVLARHIRKRDAVSDGARFARADPPSMLLVRRIDGSVQERRRYGRARGT